MCGIVSIIRRPSERPPPSASDVLDALGAARAGLPTSIDGPDVGPLEEAAEHLERADRLLRGTPGVWALLGDPALAKGVDEEASALDAGIAKLETALDSGDVEATGGEVEALNAGLVRLKDACWAVLRDRLRTAREVADLAGGHDLSPSAVCAYTSIVEALAAIDRLEVRGRDSAGLHVLVSGHALDVEAPTLRELAADRLADRLFRSGAVRNPDGQLAFVYKAAAEIGDLGDNTEALREAIRTDELLRMAVSADGARAQVLAHTRWASVGIISEVNAHPLTGEEAGGVDRPYVAAVLNGDVDNHADLKAAWDLRLPDEVMTDAKVIPVLCGRRLGEGAEPTEAFRKTAAELEGSVAVAAQSAAAPDDMYFALRGSGQALYVGLAEDAFVVASEPYGLVESCDRYLRMDGEAPGPSGTRGQVVVCHADRAGSTDGIERLSYDGTALPVADGELVAPEITTRDIARGDHPHYLLKELAESPASFRKTLRGKIVERDGRLEVALGDEALPAALRDRLADGTIRRIIVIGQGTAAVAGRSFAAAMAACLDDVQVVVEAIAATELSGFRMRADMSDTLVVAISQSGTTTDTNRTVDLARERGASVVAIVNRRGSDLTDRADGVLYTSDGRDVEMAVPSTKAFYAQVAAGFLLAFAIAEVLPGAEIPDADGLLDGLRRLPVAMEEVVSRQERIGDVARRLAPSRRYWAVVGNGSNRVAAEEVRIKLSELCYKSIACDVTEDKKHIDLAAEPLIVVCAAGLEGSNADDVAKEVAIYRAHKAAPVVICTEGEGRFGAALEVIGVPKVHPGLAFVLSAMAGHLFGYEAALAIDEGARPLREARAACKEATGNGVVPHRLIERLTPTLRPTAERFFEGVRAGTYNGHLEANTAVRLTSLFRYATGIAPLDAYQVEHGKVGTPAVVVEDLIEALTRSIEELTRPIDAIKHQAKTVTVGISRADESFLRVPLVARVLEAGAARDRLSYRTLRTLVALDAAVSEVRGHTHYGIEGDPATEEAQIQVVDKGGIARDIPSRTDRDPTLRGSKHRVSVERQVLVTRGRRDDRPVILVPETKGTEATGLTLLHVDFHDRLSPEVMRSVLDGYRDRYSALEDLVTETEPTFRQDLLGEIAVGDLLCASIQALADRWREAASSP